MTFDEIARFSAFPVVHIGRSCPRDGFLLPLTGSCSEYFESGTACQEHYRRLSATTDGTFVQCPFGFTSVAGRAGAFRLALTGVIAFPRFQSKAETRMAKHYPRYRVSRESVLQVAATLKAIAGQVQEIELNTVRQHSMALHEIRKLNRQVKQTAERLCQRESPEDLDAASPDLVRILKTSELMSRQFDVIEILANEELATLPLNSVSEIYKIFDKCARIYRTPSKRFVLDAPAGYAPRIEVCDKTFPIIPSVLIENAFKYSLDSEIRVAFGTAGPHAVIVRVSNVAQLSAPLTEAVFDRGFRGTHDAEGSGNGLYVAQLVAKQHGTAVRLETVELPGGRAKVTFWVSLPIFNG